MAISNAQVLSELSSTYQQTAAEIAAGVTPVNYAYVEGDIRRYGATTASADNHVAINNALAVSNAGGAMAYIPGGTWTITTALSPIGVSSMRGEGAQSIIFANGCDGLDFPASAPANAVRRVFRDFQLLGTSQTANAGISCSVGGTSAAWQIDFEDIGITSFNYAVYAACFRSCTFRALLGFNLNYGIYFLGQNVNIEIAQCQLISSDTNPGTWGISFQADGSNRTTQSVQIDQCLLYKFARGIYSAWAIEIQIDNCDISQMTSVGVQCDRAEGGFWVTHCWIETNANAATTGVQLTDRPSWDAGNPVVINENHFECDQANAGSLGIYVGTHWDGTTINDNEFVSFQTGVENNGAANLTCKWNKFQLVPGNNVLINSTLCTDNEIGPNLVSEGIPLAFGASMTKPPAGFRYFARGNFTGSLTGMTGATNVTVYWSCEGSTVTLQWNQNLATSNATTMTMIGIPVYLSPPEAQGASGGVVRVVDNATHNFGCCFIDNTGTITFSNGAGDAVAFTNTGSKGIAPGSFTYALQ